MAVREVLKLGNPRLYEVSAPVSKEEIPALRTVIQDLHDTLMDFRAAYGAGRAIAAPQIGVMKRMIYVHVTEPVAFVNPALTALSADMMEVWTIACASRTCWSRCYGTGRAASCTGIWNGTSARWT